jgi:hypothetical protein
MFKPNQEGGTEEEELMNFTRITLIRINSCYKGRRNIGGGGVLWKWSSPILLLKAMTPPPILHKHLLRMTEETQVLSDWEETSEATSEGQSCFVL